MDVFDWSALLAGILPDNWIENRGLNVKLALVDTGVNFDVHSLGHLDKAGRKFFVGKEGFTLFDQLGKDGVTDGLIPGGHGTRLASILAGKADVANGDQLNGLAFNCDFYVIKARQSFMGGGDFSSYKTLLFGLELAAELGIDIAVTAQVFNKTERDITPFDEQKSLQRIEASGMQVYCAVENRAVGEDWSNLTQDYFPGIVPFFCKVASAPSDIGVTKGQIAGSGIHFLLGGFPAKVYSTGNRLIAPRFSNSLATAVLGGAAALCTGFMKAGGIPVSRTAVMQQLAGCSKPVTAADGVYATPSIFKNF